MNTVLFLYALAAGAYGITAVLFPGFLIPLLWNNAPGAEAHILLQGWGSGLLGFASMAWLARKQGKTAQLTIVTGILIYFGGAVITWAIDSLWRSWTLFGIISFATYFIFAVPFIYIAYLRRSNTL